MHVCITHTTMNSALVTRPSTSASIPRSLSIDIFFSAESCSTLRICRPVFASTWGVRGSGSNGYPNGYVTTTGRVKDPSAGGKSDKTVVSVLVRQGSSHSIGATRQKCQ
jgi:hypothetical protein